MTDLSVNIAQWRDGLWQRWFMATGSALAWGSVAVAAAQIS